MDVAEREFTMWATTARPRLMRTATALTAGDHHLAEDLVQTALAKTFAVWGRVRRDEARGESPDRFVHQVLVRAFVDVTRRPWWRRERHAPPEPPVEPAEPEPTPPEDVFAIRDALAALPPEQRAVVVLRYWAGHDVTETAKLLRCPEATVRSRAARGLARLRTLLADEEHTVHTRPDVPKGVGR